MAKNVFIVGFDDFHRPLLEALPAARECRFHTLLEKHELRDPASVPLRELLGRARRRLERFPGTVDAVCTYWDFPATCIAPILAAERGLPHAPLDAVLRCEHKYWSRVEQQKVAPAHVPGFCAVDPFDDAAVAGIDLAFPFWLKPVKSFNAYLGFYIGDRADLDRAIRRVRSEIHRLAEPFNDVLARVDLPPDIAPVDGYQCIAEEIISRGRQCTLEGYEHGGQIHTLGIVDSHRYPGRSTFSRYEYPSTLPEPVKERIAEISAAVIRHLGYRDGTFNIEYFWDPDRDHLWLLEINPRVSQSHAELFASVDGQANHAATLDLALGREPRFGKRRGEHACAAKFYVRSFRDGVVARIAGADELAAIARDVGGTRVQLLVSPGVRLSETFHQESYSYELAWIYTAGDSEAELLRKFEAARERLGLVLDPVEGRA